MNKKIAITGATKGIGKAIAQKFATEGWDLALCARNENDLLRLKSELHSPKIEILTQTCDVGKKEEVKLLADKILAQLGRVDVIINNAGIFIPGQVINEAEGTLEKLIETNLYSAYHFSRMLLPKMIQNKSGHIFNMCSVASINAYPNGGSYSISKFAMLGLSKALREELKPHSIKVTSIIPGATLTDSWSGTNLPESRFMKPEDIANAVWDIYHLSESTVVEEIVLRPVLGDL
ncbi:MAG: SDR family oxidoreductase [Chitinophagales bacterium]